MMVLVLVLAARRACDPLLHQKHLRGEELGGWCKQPGLFLGEEVSKGVKVPRRQRRMSRAARLDLLGRRRIIPRHPRAGVVS